MRILRKLNIKETFKQYFLDNILFGLCEHYLDFVNIVKNLFLMRLHVQLL